MRNPRRIALAALALGVLLAFRGELQAVRVAIAGVPGSARAVVAAGAVDLQQGSRAETALRWVPPRAGRAQDAPAPERGAAAPAISGATRVRPDDLAAEPDTERRSRDADTSSPPLPHVDAPSAPAGSVTTSISGWDPAAPRRLTLWRVEHGRRALLAQTQSAADGPFRFPEVAAGSRELVVTAAGDALGMNAARVALPALATEPPVGQVYAAADAGLRVRIWPSASAATVLVSSGGRELARRPVPVLGEMPGRALDVAVALRPEETALWIAEERADGARSAWRRLEPQPPVDESPSPASTP